MSLPIGRGYSAHIGRLAASALAIALAMLPARAEAPDGETLALELNDASANGKACRLSFVITNGQRVAVDDMALELVLFDKGGRVGRFVVVRSGKVPAGRDRVRQFDIPEVACADISRVLLNDVKECAGDGLTPALCSDRIKASSRTVMGFEN